MSDVEISGGPSGIRTQDRRIKSPMLFPTGLNIGDLTAYLTARRSASVRDTAEGQRDFESNCTFERYLAHASFRF